MCENYRTIGRDQFNSSTEHKHQHCTMCNHKFAVPEFTGLPMIVSLYDSSISDLYSFMVDRKSMIVTPSSKAKAIKKMTFSLYPCRFLFETNTIIASTTSLSDFMQPYHSCGYKF